MGTNVDPANCPLHPYSCIAGFSSDNYVKMKLTRENTCLDYPAPCPGSSSSSQSDRKAGPILNKNDDDELIKIIDIDRARKNSFSNSYLFPNTTENFDAHPICESFWNMRRAANIDLFPVRVARAGLWPH